MQVAVNMFRLIGEGCSSMPMWKLQILSPFNRVS